MRTVFFVLTTGLLLACNPCVPGQQRCSGTAVEICRPDKKWTKVQDCSKLYRTDRKFICCCKKDKCFCAPKPKVKR